MAKKIELGLNTIFFGPPGTGKTYNTVIAAMAIINGKSFDKQRSETDTKEKYEKLLDEYRKYKADGRIAFTTFHQSFGYEEFIEGIKPDVDEKGNIKYQVMPGIFKEFCYDALSMERKYGINKNTKIWHVNEDILSEDRNYLLVDLKSLGAKNAEKVKKELNQGDLILVNKDDKKIVAVGIFQRFEGGKTNVDIQKTSQLNIDLRWKNLDISLRELSGKKEITQKYPIYEIKDITKYDVFQLLLQDCSYKKDFCTDKKGQQLDYVFIIDEINRGNISKIFGELITLVEKSKRLGEAEGMAVKLPYSGKEFGIPYNVHVIGTMNTADRSIALMDTALRRRFSFAEMMPDPSLLNGVTVKDKTGKKEIEIKQLLKDMNEKIEFLYDREHTIGHAYFMPLKESNTIETLEDIFKNKIIPLLQEYFYDDYEKIRLVLGDNKLTKEEKKLQFIKVEPKEASDLFGKPDSKEVELENSKTYIINDEAFSNIYAYKHILKPENENIAFRDSKPKDVNSGGTPLDNGGKDEENKQDIANPEPKGNPEL